MRDRRSGGAKIVKRLVIVAVIVLAVTFGLPWRDMLRPALAARP